MIDQFYKVKRCKITKKSLKCINFCYYSNS
jgi:hypothetical protein